ncbi:hypothetical protein [Dactylosporangium darangshiense]
MLDAVSDAIQAGWEAPRILSADDEDADAPDDDDSPDDAILDYRILGRPGGAIILVVLDGAGLMQTSLAATGLAQHLTTWSPGLLQYAPDEVKISKIDKPYDDENWLPPLDDDATKRPSWHLAELLEDQLQEIAAQYLIAHAIRSLWNPGAPPHQQRAWDVVAGAVEPPWGGQLSHALGVLLVRAARFEHQSGSQTKLVVQGEGSPDLAADLLRRARLSASEPETGWTDDEMLGHVLIERFMEEHQLLWNRVVDDEPPEATEERSDRQLRALLWAGLRALATMAAPLAHLTGPWQVLDTFGDDTIISILAQAEEEQNEEDAEEDAAELESAAAAHVLVWLTIRHPGLLDTPAGNALVQRAAQNNSSFHHVIHDALLMAGSGPLTAALAEQPAPARLRLGINAFVAALATTEHADTDEAADAYDDMNLALERILARGTGLAKRIRYLLAVTGLTARLTETDANPRRTIEGHVSTPQMLTHYMLLDPAMHATLILHQDINENAVLRTHILSLAAQVAPIAAGDLAAELPELEGDDPRLEPAARTRALGWIESALQVAHERGQRLSEEDNPDRSADAQTLVTAMTAGAELPDGWPIQRFVSAAAEAAASILHATGAANLAQDVFTDS